MILRLGIFGLRRQELTGRAYEKPVALRHFALLAPELPVGFAPEGDPVEGPAPEALGRLPTPVRLSPPEAGAPALHAAYRSQGRLAVHLLTIELPDPEAAEAGLRSIAASPPTSAWNQDAFVTDDRLTLVLAQAPEVPAPLVAPLQRKLAEQKTVRRRFEKLRVIGNAALKFLIDLMVGAFLFVVFLFLSKYFLIIRPVEKG